MLDLCNTPSSASPIDIHTLQMYFLIYKSGPKAQIRNKANIYFLQDCIYTANKTITVASSRPEQNDVQCLLL